MGCNVRGEEGKWYQIPEKHKGKHCLTSTLQAGEVMLTCVPISGCLEMFENVTNVLSSQSKVNWTVCIIQQTQAKEIVT